MATAVISDIHGNIEALRVVIADIEQRGITDVVCLGDIIGYGPNPNDCLDVVMKTCRWNLMGNHEEAVLYGAVGFNPKAKMAIDWTRDQLNLTEEPPEKRNARWKFLGDLELTRSDLDFEFVHGSPRDPVREYIFPTDVLDHEKLGSIFEHVDRACFMGHTHLPGVISEDGRFTPPREDGFTFTIEEGGPRILVNTGSVGQPRDGDARSCYLTIDGNTLTWRRLEYDVDKTIEKIKEIDRLPAYLASRLREGR